MYSESFYGFDRRIDFAVVDVQFWGLPRAVGEISDRGMAVATVFRVVAHVLLFLVAIGVFYAGLGIGLTRNPTLGTAMWGVAAVIAALNLWWVLRWRRR